MNADVSESPTPPAFGTLELDVDGAVATVWLARPDQANAMNAPMWDEIETCFRWLDAADRVRVVVLAGRGRHFCAGIDLEMLQSLHSEAEPARRAERLRRRILELQGNLSAIEDCRKPVLAAVHGACLGGGLDIVSCCDLRYATRDARFAIREIDVGLVADVGSLQRLPCLLGEGLVRELAYTGREVSGDEGTRIGLVNASFDDHELLHAGVRAIADTIASKSPLAIRGIKQTLAYGRNHGVADGLDYAATWNAAMLSFVDVGEALGAMRDRRVARFDD